MNILLTGGAGYVGSVCAEELLAQNHHVVILDNLATGHREAVPAGAVFIESDVSRGDVVSDAVRRHRIDSCMHFAGETLVTESMTNPRLYFENNFSKGMALLDTLMQHGVHRIIFSSTAAVFGEPLFTPITETHPTQPINAYGESKLMFEKLLAWYHRAYGLRYIAVRYFNAAGASVNCGEDHRPETHLIPLLLEAAMDESNDESHKAQIWGDDYPTPDGTCVRDYVHVIDIAQAHILALHALQQGRSGVYNIGSGCGHSVRQVVQAVEAVTGKRLRVGIGPRRSGDPAVLVASPEKLISELGWRPQHSELAEIVRSAWQWKQQSRLLHPANGASRAAAEFQSKLELRAT
jgi:UDP-glucose 4-epimerase